MRVHFKAKTKLGKWSAWLIVAFAVCLVALRANIVSATGVSTWYRYLLLALMFSPAQALGIAAFIIGLISIVRSKERSIAVYLAVIFGSFGIVGLIFRILLIIVPHRYF